MDSKFIQNAVQIFLFESSHTYQALNFARSGYYESDILAITKSLRVTEVEVKISKADYKADFKKKYKHLRMAEYKRQEFIGVPNRFYFAVPEGLITEVPDYAGLIYVSEKGEVKIIKDAPLIHKEKAGEKLLLAMLENLTAKTIFGCQYMTYQNRKSKEIYLRIQEERAQKTKDFIEFAKAKKDKL